MHALLCSGLLCPTVPVLFHCDKLGYGVVLITPPSITDIGRLAGCRPRRLYNSRSIGTHCSTGLSTVSFCKRNHGFMLPLCCVTSHTVN